MKKIISVLFTLCCLFSCMENTSIYQVDETTNTNLTEISFSKYTDNLTRANSYERLDLTHTSFGVYGFYSDDSEIMNQYLVKLDKTKINGTDTTYTDPANGKSAWYYADLTTADGAAATQYLKFFDKSKTSAYFIGYSPYKTTDFTSYDKTTKTLTYKNISSFSVHQTLTDADKIKIDANELLYSKDNHNTYNTDVLINFKRGMAKVQLGFRDGIPGHKIQLIDLDATNNYTGVQLVPATTDQAKPDVVQAAKTNRPTWKDNADTYTIKFDTNITLTSTDNSESNNNIVFAATNTEDYTYNSSSIKVIKEGTGNYSMSDDVYYMIPQSSTTLGFTLKVSYRLIPEDGTSDIYVYDARVYIPNSVCKWEAGKSYKYLVTITAASTGNTDKNATETDMALTDTNTDGDNDPTTNPEKYVDGDDPRVPTESALHPITFEAVVYEYESTENNYDMN